MYVYTGANRPKPRDEVPDAVRREWDKIEALDVSAETKLWADWHILRHYSRSRAGWRAEERARKRREREAHIQKVRERRP